MRQRLVGVERDAALAQLPLWSLLSDRDAIVREFVFPDFRSAFAFMTAVAEASERRDHHPEWSNVYGRVRVVWTTHDVGGLTAHDVAMAAFCDRAAAAR